MRAFTTLCMLSCFRLAFAASLDDFRKRVLSAGASLSSNHISSSDAIDWLVQHQPARINTSHDFVVDHATEAVRARDAYPWAQAVPMQLFQEYVLPFAHFDEKPEPWRKYFNSHLDPLVKDVTSLRGAATAIQQGIWMAFGDPPVHFKSNSTPEVLSPMSDLLVTRYGSCTAMSIFLADGLRSCGVPARVVGINEWNRPEKGNHNWVEAWFDNKWNFIDAAPGETEWNNAWFSGVAAQSIEHGVHGIYTPTWNSAAKTGEYVVGWRDPPLVLPAIELTSTYKH